MVALSLLLLAAAIWDIYYKKIPNFLVACIFLWGIVYAFYTGGISASLSSLFRAVLVLFLFFPAYQLRLLGAGDVKYLAALATVFGGKPLLYFLFFSFAGAFLFAVFSCFLKREKEAPTSFLGRRVPMAGAFFLSFLIHMGGFY